MPHEVPLIATVAIGLAVAFVGGFVATRLRLPALVGYLLAGVAVGPFSPGFVADPGLARQLAEIGVILLMFGVGLHFSFGDLLAVRRIALPGAMAQIVGATATAATLAWLWGWTFGAGLVFGLALSVASTVVLLRALEERGAVESLDGRIAVGWLIVEDLAMVLVLILLPAFAGALGGTTGSAEARSLWPTLGLTVGKVALFVAMMAIVGRRVIPWLLSQVAKTGSRELFTLSVLAVALGIAFGSAALFGVSFALGAFFAGVGVSESDLSHRVAQDSLPLKDAFSALFFVSVGMLFDPATVMRHPLELLAVLGVVVVGKSLAAFAIVLLFRYPVSTALLVSASLAQIGEFSFILMALGSTLGLTPPEANNLVVAGAVLSITLNPLVFRAIDPVLERLRRSARFARRAAPPEDELATLPLGVAPMSLRDHAVIVGYGRVGGLIGSRLADHGLPYLVVEQNREYVEHLRKEGLPVIYGDAATPAILQHARLESARLLVIATPDALQARQIIEFARSRNPDIGIVVRTHSDEEQAYLEAEGVGVVVMGERALAQTMAVHALRSFGIEEGTDGERP